LVQICGHGINQMGLQWHRFVGGRTVGLMEQASAWRYGIGVDKPCTVLECVDSLAVWNQKSLDGEWGRSLSHNMS